jgi:hypothetical protein
MILVSPQGVRALFAHTVRGVFRAQGEEWLRFHNRRREFRPARKDLQSEALSLAAQVRRFLESQEVGVRDVEAVLVFTHPRTLVDSATPRARVVPADAIEYFAANLEQLPARLEKERVRLVVERLLEPLRAEAELPPRPEPEPPPRAEVRAPERAEAEPPPPSPPSEPAPSQVELAPGREAYPEWQALRQAQEEAYQQAQASGLEVQEKPEPPAPREPRFRLAALTTGQWIILGVLLLLQALVLIAFVLLVFTDLLLP